MYSPRCINIDANYVDSYMDVFLRREAHYPDEVEVDLEHPLASVEPTCINGYVANELYSEPGCKVEKTTVFQLRPGRNGTTIQFPGDSCFNSRKWMTSGICRV